MCGKTAAGVEAAEALLHTLSKLSGKLKMHVYVSHIHIYVYDLEIYVCVYIHMEPYLYVLHTLSKLSGKLGYIYIYIYI